MSIAIIRKISILSLVFVLPIDSRADDDPAATEATPPSEAITIADEPRTIDPATLMPPVLAAPATVEFDEAALREVAEWIQSEHGITVLFDNAALSDAGLLLSDPVTDRLDGQPLYLLLNRLRSLGLAWYMDGDLVRITTRDVAANRLTTETYTVGDLYDADYDTDGLIETIQGETEGPWMDLDGIGGTISGLGDVLFVRQTDAIHREVAGMLAALRNHGRRTFVLDPPQHDALRTALDAEVTVAFNDTPLVEAVAELSRQTNVDIRLDLPALRSARIREREPVTLALTDRALRVVLDVMLSEHDLTWLLRDGVMWISRKSTSANVVLSAIYDVRDLCRDAGESDGLIDAVMNQTEGPWVDMDGVGGTISAPLPGTMIIRQTEAMHADILQLLEMYRAALRASKPRDRNAVDPNEIVTRYYRMPTAMANDLVRLLPTLVKPESWQGDDQPEAKGTIVQATSDPELRSAKGGVVVEDGEQREGMPALAVPQSTLIVDQTRDIHDEIATLIERIKVGFVDSGFGSGGFGGGGFGGGGFGGGFFSTREAQRPSSVKE